MKEMVFETIEGYRIIGRAITPPNDLEFSKMFGSPHIFKKDSFEGYFIHRTRLNRFTFLGNHEIVRIRPVTIFDTEYDPKLGIGK